MTSGHLLRGIALVLVTTTLQPRSLYRSTVLLGLHQPEAPSDNATTSERAALGRRLFEDPRISKSGAISCATCHQPSHAFADLGQFSHADGTPVHRRNAPSLLNVAYRRSLGWEGQARTLEDQVRQSFGPYGDLGISIGDALARISSDDAYHRECRDAYQSDVDVRCLTRSIAAFERTIVSGGSRFDQYLFGEKRDRLTPEERRGWELFSGRAACIDCHDVFHRDVNPLGGAYATFSDERFHNLGVGYHEGVMSDSGRYETTRNPEDFGAFKTPMLRNVSRTAPYMHDGSLATLEDVVEFYNRGGNPNPHQSAGLKVLYLSASDKESLVAFLRALDTPADTVVPPAQLADRPRIR